ncbi:hypothetical protein EMIHUDRAFT_220032 [Emiliania huxleyi CCMP1516]|uniref:Uncharacterized protein n=2 Tax=Emiliania huxleyi TaxID=2903 RepID=A0A0D3I2W7_EMIH1|nr:hypothetical protein EMIHUDRAFT_220032 [Emiliania huxleyi CCMP1516]EOD05602.1 hypothetical protein EMIHUDRAFT_220032 [Emiliania huxleyi CCMP1516]|eukprot:XP_005758031.1 hypothetical protein EMIHUDRAFT_220032 [Emiliania huxleyi CCMP1516]
MLLAWASSEGEVCRRGQHGPRCAGDADCAGVEYCVRCAQSGFCTDVPLPGGGTPRRDGKMDCGEGVPLCGVLTLETGYGGGYYHHAHPSVHGLWPQLEFEQHEWSKHGTCAGAADADDFFAQVCNLSSAPLALLSAERQKGGSLADMTAALKQEGHTAGYPLRTVDPPHSQLELSACASRRRPGMVALCSERVPMRGHGEHGPACESDVDCAHVTGCVRCAQSGFCTDVPLPAAE